MPSISRLRQLDLNITRRMDKLTQLREILHKQLISLQVMEMSAKAALRKFELEEEKEKAKERQMATNGQQSSSSAEDSSSVPPSTFDVDPSTSDVDPSTSEMQPSTSGVHPFTSEEDQPSTSGIPPYAFGMFAARGSRLLSPTRLSDDDSLVCLEPLDLQSQVPTYEEIFIESEDDDEF